MFGLSAKLSNIVAGAAGGLLITASAAADEVADAAVDAADRIKGKG